MNDGEGNLWGRITSWRERQPDSLPGCQTISNGEIVGKTKYWKKPVYLNGLPVVLPGFNGYNLSLVDPIEIRKKMAEKMNSDEVKLSYIMVDTNGMSADGRLTSGISSKDPVSSWQELKTYCSMDGHRAVREFIQENKPGENIRSVTFTIKYMQLGNKIVRVARIRDDSRILQYNVPNITQWQDEIPPNIFETSKEQIDNSRIDSPNADNELEAILRIFQPSYYILGSNLTAYKANPYLP